MLGPYMIYSTHIEPRKRHGGPRSKIGCLVCRQRRVKCDERKPSCERCQSSGWPCEYGSRLRKQRTNLKDSPEKTTSPARQKQCILVTTPHANPTISIAEQKALAYFLQVARGELFGYLLSDFWTYLVPQRCHSNSVIRSAVVALSSIHQDATSAREIPGLSQKVLKEGPIDSDDLYKAAVVDLRVYIERSAAPSKADVLVTCAALICYMLLRRRPEEATQHLDKGAAVAHSWAQDMKSLDPHTKGHLEQDDFQTITDAFYALDVHASAYNDDRLPSLRFLHEHNFMVADLMPLDHFASLGQAQRTLNQLFSTAFADLIQCAPYKLSTCQKMPRDFITRRQSVRMAFKKWLINLNQLETQQEMWSSGTPAETEKAWRAIAVMKTQHLAVENLLNETLCENDEVPASPFDTQAPLLLHWAELAIERCEPRSPAKHSTPSSHRPFSMDLGVGPPLFLLAIKTSDPGIRDRTVSLLSRIQRWEGWYDPSSMVQTISYLHTWQNKAAIPQIASRVVGHSNVKAPRNLEWTAEHMNKRVFGNSTIGTIQDLGTARTGV